MVYQFIDGYENIVETFMYPETANKFLQEYLENNDYGVVKVIEITPYRIILMLDEM